VSTGLTNVPEITDVSVMGELLTALGCTVERPARHERLIVVPDCSQINPVARRISSKRCAPPS